MPNKRDPFCTGPGHPWGSPLATSWGALWSRCLAFATGQAYKEIVASGDYFLRCQRVFLSILRCLCLDAFFWRHFFTEPTLSPPSSYMKMLLPDRWQALAHTLQDSHLAMITQRHLERLGLDGRARDLGMTPDETVLNAVGDIQDLAVLQHDAVLDLAVLDQRHGGRWM